MPEITKSCKRKRGIHVTSCRSVSSDPGSSDRVESFQERMDWEESVDQNVKLKDQICLEETISVENETLQQKGNVTFFSTFSTELFETVFPKMKKNHVNPCIEKYTVQCTYIHKHI